MIYRVLLSDRGVLNKDILELGKNIQSIRKEKHMTQKELGQAAFMSDKALSRIENGNIIPGIDKIYSIADALNVPPLALGPQRFRDELLMNRTSNDLLHNYYWKQLDEEKQRVILSIMKEFVEKH